MTSQRTPHWTSYSLTVMCHFQKKKNNAKYLRFYCWEVESGEGEIWFKIWSLPDYLGELTA